MKAMSNTLNVKLTYTLVSESIITLYFVWKNSYLELKHMRSLLSSI